MQTPNPFTLVATLGCNFGWVRLGCDFLSLLLDPLLHLKKKKKNSGATFMQLLRINIEVYGPPELHDSRKTKVVHELL